MKGTSVVDVIAVNFGQLAAAEAELASAQAAIASSLSDLNSNLQPLLASWVGDGGEAYTIQQTRWNSASADLNETLRLIHLSVGEANASYQATERRIAAAWAGL
jgi:WXG100 family type VII secretion target